MNLHTDFELRDFTPILRATEFKWKAENYKGSLGKLKSKLRWHNLHRQLEGLMLFVLVFALFKFPSRLLTWKIVVNSPNFNLNMILLYFIPNLRINMENNIKN